MNDDRAYPQPLLAPRHLEDHGAPFCTAPAAGALVVEEPVDVTCVACLAKIGTRLEAGR